MIIDHQQDPKKTKEKIAELENGLSLWKVGIDMLREMDKNARVMESEKFELLKEIIEEDKRLESLPLVTLKKDGRGEFLIISGHHRTRAARMAGLQQIHVLVDENELTLDQIKSKQLSALPHQSN